MRSGPSGRWDRKAYDFLVTKKFVSIMPQAISCWCRNLGHEVFYATYFGNREPETLIPADLDVLFIATYTQASALAYALAKLYRKRKTLTIIGGPHAKQFPEDCLRFFDIVVRDCDQALITEILSDMPRGQILNSGRTLRSLPSVEERMPEIRASTFFMGKPYPFASIPLLSSVGCPNSCDFCIDWDNPYSLLSLDQLEADLKYIYGYFPGVMVGLHDPNFAVKFESVFDVLERVPHRKKTRFIVEASLPVLRGSRLERMRNAGKFYVVPGIESWAAYSNKVGAGSKAEPREKLERVIEQLNEIRPCVEGIQANFIFGLDCDAGEEPVELTKEFASRVPFVMPNFNIPVPFGNTPLYARYTQEDRLLASMPFSFYYMPYVVVTVQNYGPIEFYEKMIEMLSYVSSTKMLLARLESAPSPFAAAYNTVKALGNHQMTGRLRQLLGLLKTDRQFREFHEHKTNVLPEFYHYQYERLLGPYAELMSREDRRPVLVECQKDMAPAKGLRPSPVSN
jgi:Radical SAM superfamily